MQNILKRPMFRKGGLTQRENYQRGTEPEFILGENPNKDAFFPGMEQRMMEMGMGAGGGRDMSGIESIKISDLIEKPKKEMPPARKAPSFMERGIADARMLEEFMRGRSKQKDNRLLNFLGRFGPALASETSGSLLQNIARASGAPMEALIRETQAMRNREQSIEDAMLNRAIKRADMYEQRAYDESQREMGANDQDTAAIQNMTRAARLMGLPEDLANYSEQQLKELNKGMQILMARDPNFKEVAFDENLYKTRDPSSIKVPTTDDEDVIDNYNRLLRDTDARNARLIGSKKIHEALLDSGKMQDLGIAEDFKKADIMGMDTEIEDGVFYDIRAVDVRQANIPAPEEAVYMFVDTVNGVNQYRFFDAAFNEIV